MEELPDASYEEVFGAKLGETHPRRTIIAVGMSFPPPYGNTLAPEVRFLNDTFQEHRTNALKRHSPSAAAEFYNYLEIQASSDALLDGCFTPDGENTAAYPVELYHPAFATYKRDSENPALDVHPDFVCEVAALMRALSAVVEDVDTGLLASILGTELKEVYNSNGTSSGFCSLIETPIDSISAAPVILEIQRDADPSVQASFSYEQFFCAPERAALLEQSNCPSFLIGLSGPWLVICGAVMIHRTIVQRLSAYEWYACSRVGDDAQVLNIARRLFALRNAIAELRAYYTKLKRAATAKLNVNRFYPSITSFNNDTVKFRYVKLLEESLLCIVFLAQRLDDGEEFVVKFVSRYSADAHRHMAKGGFAPRLLVYEPLGKGYGDWALVAMERVDGQTIHDKYGDDRLPAEVIAAVQKALNHLRKEKYIMPDLRRPNAMLVDGGVRFVDFDWACVEGGGARYPVHLSKDVRESSGAKDYEVITREHEESMFEKNFQ